MKIIYYVLALVTLNCTFCGNMLAADTPNDLSEADKVIKSFFTAAKAKDTKAVEAMLSPRIKQFIKRKKFTLQEFMKAWGESPIVKVGKAVDISPANKPGVLAEAEIVYLRDGKKVKSSVRVILIDNQWLWYEK